MGIPLAVLIVEDSESDAQLIVRLLKKSDYEITFAQVETAEQMRAALLKKQDWDVVISDYSLPQFNGHAALMLLQEMKLDIPYIAVSGTMGEETAVAMMKAGAHDYLMKGNLTRLVPAIERELAQSEGRRKRAQAEEEVKLGNKRFQALIENNADAITLLDANGIAIYDSPAAPGMLGYGHNELIGQNAFRLMHPDDLPNIQDQFQTLVKTPGARANSIFRLRHKSGTWLWIEAVATNLLTEPSIRAIVLNYRDISERKMAEKTLRESEEKFRMIAEQLSDMIYLTDAQGIINYVSPAVVSIFGYTPDEMQGHVFTDFLTEAEVPKAVAAYRRALTTGKSSENLELTMKRKDGSVFTGELRGSLYRNENIAINIGLIRDVTKRKRDEEELVKLRKAVEAAGEAIFLTDKEGIFTFVNPEFTRLYGYAAAELVGKSTPRVLKGGLLSSSDYQIFWQTLLAKQIVKSEIVNKTKDGRLISVEVSANPVLDDHENIVGFLAIEKDITARKHAEEALRLRESYLTAIFENQPGLVWLKDVDSRFLTVNQSFADSCGKTSTADLAGKTDFDIWPKELAEKYRAADARVIRNKTSTIVEEPIFDRGETKWFETFKTPILNDHGEVIGTTGYSRDITKRKQSEERIQRQLEHLTALSLIDQAISASFELRLILNVLLEQVTAQLRVDAAAVLLLNPATHILEYSAGHGFRSNAYSRAKIRLGDGQAGKAALERKLITHPDFTVNSPVFAMPELIASESFTAYYAVPLIAKGQVKGVLEIFHRARLTPDEEWLNFLQTLAGQTAIAIDNAELFNNLHRSNTELMQAYDATIEGWSRALDLRDKETEGHTERVTEIALRLAERMGQSDEELVHIRRGGLLHDIGKLGVPDGILLKPEPLTDDEWVLMKRHPQYAYDMLAPVGYLRRALDIPYCHHEKWDGTGYPRGLKGETIPLAARIFAVVDVWDALRSDRPYRAGWSDDKVREHIHGQSGIHFDPQVVEAFMRMLEEK